MYSFSNKNQKIALIGCGYWGTIIAKTLISQKFKNIIIYDSNKKNLLKLKKKYKKLNLLKNFKNILSDISIKNILIAVPPTKNFNLIKKSIYFKKNVFVEKPA